jgi:hypothetical protein
VKLAPTRVKKLPSGLLNIQLQHQLCNRLKRFYTEKNNLYNKNALIDLMGCKILQCWRCNLRSYIGLAPGIDFTKLLFSDNLLYSNFERISTPKHLQVHLKVVDFIMFLKSNKLIITSLNFTKLGFISKVCLIPGANPTILSTHFLLKLIQNFIPGTKHTRKLGFICN